MNEPQTIAQWMARSQVTFGTSGARGRIEDMTDQICYLYTIGFIQYLKHCKTHPTLTAIGVAGDLRASTPRILAAICKAVADAGLRTHNCGYIPTPALALYGIGQQIPTIMVTGSHIPDDRNGIKFYTAFGEILKPDEHAIKQQRVSNAANLFDAQGQFVQAPTLPATDPQAERNYVRRYLDFFGAHALAGLRIGVYEHSCVGRDISRHILTGLGAEVVRLGRSETFIPVDTEAIRPEDVTLAHQWAAEQPLHAIVSMDGDGDRPLISDASGNWLRGDIAGILCADFLRLEIIATPVSSNTAVEKCGLFHQVLRTKIGSPYVITAMQHAGAQQVGGYEANGGFLLQTPLKRDGRSLAALPTRDAVVVWLSILATAKREDCTVADLCAKLPQRFTESGRIKNFPSARSTALLNAMITAQSEQTRARIAAFFAGDYGPIASFDTCDGLRVVFTSEEIVHLRPSGNAPEFRCYNEAASAQRAKQMNTQCLQKIANWRVEENG